MSSPESADSTTENHKHRHDRGYSTIAISALILAIIALLLYGCSYRSDNASPASPTICKTGSPGPTGAAGSDGKAGLSAYDLWLAMGNTGTTEDFLTSLIGQPGPAGVDGKTIYYGSDGVTGAPGSTGATGADGSVGATGSTGVGGKSAYQLWIEAGNTGTETEFLVSLIGPAGEQGPAGANGADGQAGIDGLSAYEVWKSIGNTGTETDFFDSLAGVPGTDGTAGANGLSAYDIWVNNGNSGTEGQFLASLVGAAGIDGAPGVCTVGETGATGPAGDSTYQVWLNAGNVGSESVFLASLVGPQGIQGIQGIQGETGATGATGPAGTSAGGYYGSFYDTTDQTLADPATPQAWSFDSVTGASNGVTISANGSAKKTRIKFPAKGMYNIAFSTVFSTTNSSADTVDVWFRESGTDIPDSNTSFTLANRSELVAAWNFFYNCTDTSKYVEVMWWTSDAGTVTVNATPAMTNPTRPLVPSVILTVNQVGGVATQ